MMQKIQNDPDFEMDRMIDNGGCYYTSDGKVHRPRMYPEQIDADLVTTPDPFDCD